MTGPNHLWAGDWERESAASRDSRPPPPPAGDGADEPPVAAPRPRADRRRGRRRLAVVLAALGLGVAGVAYAAVAVSGHGSRPRSDPGAPAADAPITVTAPTRTFSVTTHASSDPAPAGGIQQTRWSGMTLATGVVGHADVESVSAPSAGERAGVRPGDDIVSIAGHPISGSTSLARALRGLPTGERVTVRVARGAVTHRLHLSVPPAPAP